MAKLHRSGSGQGTAEARAADGEMFLALLSTIVGKKLGWWARGGLDSLTEESKTDSTVGE